MERRVSSISLFLCLEKYLHTSVYVGNRGDILYGSQSGDSGFSIESGKLTWSHGSFYACPLDELFQMIKLGAVRKDGQTPGDDCSPIVLTQV